MIRKTKMKRILKRLYVPEYHSFRLFLVESWCCWCLKMVPFFTNRIKTTKQQDLYITLPKPYKNKIHYYCHVFPVIDTNSSLQRQFMYPVPIGACKFITNWWIVSWFHMLLFMLN